MVICECIHECVRENDGLTLAEQLLALCVTLQAVKSYFMTTYQGRWGVGDGGALWSPVF